MTKNLMSVSVAILLVAIILESISAPYRLVQALVVLGFVTLAIQLPRIAELLRKDTHDDTCD